MATKRCLYKFTIAGGKFVCKCRSPWPSNTDYVAVWPIVGVNCWCGDIKEVPVSPVMMEGNSVDNDTETEE